MSKIPRNTFKRSQNIIDDLLRSLKPPVDSWFDTIQQHWSDIVGPAVASQAVPERMEENILYVKVSNHIWIHELRSGIGQDILKKIRADICPKLKQIRWI